MKGFFNMKKIIALLLTVVLCFSLCACGGEKTTWSIVQTVDEFGDVTEDSVGLIAGTFTGNFSNTATPGSDLTVVVTIGKKAKFNHYVIGFDLKEYNNTNATYFSSDSKTFKMKIGEEVITMNLLGSEPNGTLYLGAEDYGWSGDLLFNELLNGNDVRCIINIDSSEYNFTITNDNFTTLCNEIGITAGATELTLKEALNIYLEDTGAYVEGASECIQKHMDNFEIMSAEEVKNYFDGNFLAISPRTWQDVGDYGFPNWEFQRYDVADKEVTYYSYRLDDDMKNKALKAINSDIFKKAYMEYREFNLKQDFTPRKLYYKDNLLGVDGRYEFFSPYQCRKITDDIVVLCTNVDIYGDRLADGVYEVYDILFKCEIMSDSNLLLFAVDETAVKSVVEYAQTVSLEKVNY